ncbi:hypothetical protein Q7C36_001075 [Tachysurus vachellii]|uniref:Uncharacterized protein n=1 Tax=Tachysurus vachellii TaxID=175792 RepID=A0AA88P236_TACVA|nr:hypothetical protein Q7C36_001075 [Tachysurus vachellii]
MESELERLQLEIKGVLYKLTIEQLIKVCNALQILGPEKEHVTGKTRSQVISHVIKYLEREELAGLEDEGMSDLLSIDDVIGKIDTATNINGSEISSQTESQEKLQKESSTAVQEYRPAFGPERMSETAQFQLRFAPQRFYPARRPQPRCLSCTQAVQPRARKRSVEQNEEAEQSEEEDDGDEYYPVSHQQQFELCLPEIMNPVCSTPTEPERTQAEENMSPEPDREQGTTDQMENSLEREDSFVEGMSKEEVVPLLVSSDPSGEEFQRPRRQHRRPRVFTYDRLGSQH